MRLLNLKILSSIKVLFESLVSVVLIWHQGSVKHQKLHKSYLSIGRKDKHNIISYTDY